MTEAQQIIERLLREDTATVARLEKEAAKLETKLRMKRNQIEGKRREMKEHSERFGVPMPRGTA